jgi:hypothetical protein
MLEPRAGMGGNPKPNRLNKPHEETDIVALRVFEKIPILDICRHSAGNGVSRTSFDKALDKRTKDILLSLSVLVQKNCSATPLNLFKQSN